MLHGDNKAGKIQTDFLVDANQEVPLKYCQDYKIIMVLSLIGRECLYRMCELAARCSLRQHEVSSSGSRTRCKMWQKEVSFQALQPDAKYGRRKSLLHGSTANHLSYLTD
jgi:hypothetical protein